LPYAHLHSLFEAIKDGGGLLVSDCAPGTNTIPGLFYKRNRLLAGAAKAVLVVEAGVKSGAKITANFANDQNKDVFVVPGPIDSPASAGTFDLMRQGASPVSEASHILEEMFSLEPSIPGIDNRPVSIPPLVVPDHLAAVYEHLSDDPTHIDALAESCAKPTHELFAVLLEMEISGIVKQDPPTYFRRL
jgi:DNA processing protein